jgi:hypothetical protein
MPVKGTISIKRELICARKILAWFELRALGNEKRAAN